MPKTPLPLWKRNVQPINRGLIVSVAAAIILTLGVGKGSMGSEPFIIGSYVVGAVIAGVAWSWDFRWKQVAWIIGVLVVSYSIASMLLTGQFWLALGAMALMAPITVVPSIIKLSRCMERDKRR